MRTLLLAATAALALALPASAQEEPKAAPAPSEIVSAATKADWLAIAAEDLLVMTLAPDADGKPRQVVIQLMPAPFSQGWVHNIRLFARAKWYDGISVNRVQDNYVTQWGDPNYDNPEATGKPKPLPEGLKVMTEAEYTVDVDTLSEADSIPERAEEGEGEVLTLLTGGDERLAAIGGEPEGGGVSLENLLAALSAVTEDSERIAMISITPTKTPTAPEGWHQRDSYAEWTEFWRGWPLGNREIGQWFDVDGNKVDDPLLPRAERVEKGFYKENERSDFWPLHCYGMVGVGRNYSPDTGSGAELYTVIGHAPRHLDRNIALVGRVIEGMQHLSSLPRGSGALGFYTAEEAGKRTPILTVRVASDLPASDQPAFEYLSTESEAFARYAEAIANRRDPFFIVPAGGADICNIKVPVRRVP